MYILLFDLQAKYQSLGINLTLIFAARNVSSISFLYSVTEKIQASQYTSVGIVSQTQSSKTQNFSIYFIPSIPVF